MKYDIRIPVWLIAFCVFVFVGIIFQQLYGRKTPIDIWGLKLNQPKSLSNKVIQSDYFPIGADSSGWTLNKEDPSMPNFGNYRSIKQHIKFPEPFPSDCKPHVHAAIYKLDATPGGTSQEGYNIRVSIDVTNEDILGFDALINTWVASKITSIGISWLAYCGE